MTFNDADYTDQRDDLIFRFYNIFGSFPHSGPSDAYNEFILVKGAGFSIVKDVFCSLNKTVVPAAEVTPNLIKCPMALQSKDPSSTGPVKFGVILDKGWFDFDLFYYYHQIELNDIQPRQGPADGEGVINFYGHGFRDDFKHHEVGCKVGEAIGRGTVVSSSEIRCVVEEMDLVNEGESSPVFVALNSYSWVSGSGDPLGFVPYGIDTVFPNSGPFEGFTDIMITGKGFQNELAEQARCRFGVEANYAVVEATVIDYTKLSCRSPAFALQGSSDTLSVPISISFSDEEDLKPWTEDLHRFRFYKHPVIVSASPDEVKIGRMTEIYLSTDGESHFYPPYMPPNKNGFEQSNFVCSFEDMGTSLGMYVNDTTALCVSPRVPGTAYDYGEE